jgi:hypothetical protein
MVTAGQDKSLWTSEANHQKEKRQDKREIIAYCPFVDSRIGGIK